MTDIVVDIESPEFSFQKLDEAIEENYLKWIAHHLKRANEHEDAKRHDYAVGSRKKALKWIKKLEEGIAYKNGLQYQVAMVMADRVAEDFEGLILYGDVESELRITPGELPKVSVRYPPPTSADADETFLRALHRAHNRINGGWESPEETIRERVANVYNVLLARDKKYTNLTNAVSEKPFGSTGDCPYYLKCRE